MLIDSIVGKKRKRIETTLQAGDLMRWIYDDQTAAFFRPDKNGRWQHLYNSSDNNDKFRFIPNQNGVSAHTLALVVADTCGFDFERSDKDSNDWAVVFVFKKKQSSALVGT
jgi:hypothetical protein